MSIHAKIIYIIVVFACLAFPFGNSVYHLIHPYKVVSKKGYSSKRAMLTDETYFYANRRFHQAGIFLFMFICPLSIGLLYLLCVTGKRYIILVIALLHITGALVVALFMESSLRRFINKRYGIFEKKAAREK